MVLWIALTLSTFSPPPKMLPYSEIIKYVPGVPQAGYERYIVLPAPKPLTATTLGRAAWWELKKTDFPILSSVAAFFVRRPRSACHVERTFSLIGHILTPDRRNMTNDTLRHLAIVYVNKADTKGAATCQDDDS